MMNNPAFLIVHWKIVAGKLEKVLSILPDLVSGTRTEPGNLFYKIYQSHNDDHTLILYEGYKDENALEAHRSSAHFKELVLGQIVPLLEKREATLAKELF